jgi:hypothetical protein
VIATSGPLSAVSGLPTAPSDATSNPGTDSLPNGRYFAVKIGEGARCRIVLAPLQLDLFNGQPWQTRQRLTNAIFRMGRSLSTTHLLIVPLVASGILERSDDGRFYAGLHLKMIGKEAPASPPRIPTPGGGTCLGSVEPR